MEKVQTQTNAPALEGATLLEQQLAEAAQVLTAWLDGRAPCIGLILGSAQGALAERIENPLFLSFADVPYMMTSTTMGHVGRFVCGTLGGKCVLCMQGRIHGYEGYTSQQVAFPVWLMQRLGVETLFVSNAVGAINESYEPGDFVAMTDQINFTGRNPVAAMDPSKLASRFFSMYECFDAGLLGLARRVAARENIALREGVYLGLLGPSFETAAEIRAFRVWGADMVAMSVAEEVIAARHVGMRVFGLSIVVNMACGVGGASPDTEDMMIYIENAQEPLYRLIAGMFAEL